jgi:hypothetical protein
VATGGGGFDATGGTGREAASVLLSELAVFFHGAADPLAAAIPGKTATGLAFALAVRGVVEIGALIGGFAAEVTAGGLGAGGAAGAASAGRPRGGGGGTGAALGFGGISSR